MELKDIIEEYEGVSFIFPKTANEFVNQTDEYEVNNLFNEKSLNYGRKGLFKITKDKNGKVGDFVLPIPSVKDLTILYEKVNDESTKNKIIENIEYLIKESIENKNFIRLFKPRKDMEMFENHLYLFNKILFKINKYSPNLKDIKINDDIILTFEEKDISNVDKYNLLFKVFLQNKKIYAGFDFDGTLGKTEAETVIKRINTDINNISNEGKNIFKTVFYSKDINEILNSDDIYFINEIKKDKLNNLNLNNNEYLRLTKYYNTNEINDNNKTFIKNLSKDKDLQIQLTIVDKDNNKVYYNSINDINFSKLDKDTKLKVDIRSENINKINMLYNNVDDRIQHIQIIEDKNIINEEIVKQQEKIEIKKFVDYEDILNNKNLKYSVIEQTMYFSPVTYNSYHKQPNDTVPDYSQFRSAKVLKEKTKIYENVKQKLLKWHSMPSSFTNILTARGKLDNKKLTMSFFNENGIPVGNFKDGKIHLFFSGNFEVDKNLKISKQFKDINVVLEKLSFINKVLENTSIKKVVFYEDNKKMLEGLDDFLKRNYPKIEKELYFVNEKGKIKEFKNLSKKDKNLSI